MTVSQTFAEHDQSAYASVAVLKGMDGLKTIGKDLY